MIKTFNLEEFEQGYMRSGYYKKINLLENIRERINHIIKHKGIEDPELFYLMSLAVMVKRLITYVNWRTKNG